MKKLNSADQGVYTVGYTSDGQPPTGLCTAQHSPLSITVLPAFSPSSQTCKLAQTSSACLYVAGDSLESLTEGKHLLLSSHPQSQP